MSSAIVKALNAMAALAKFFFGISAKETSFAKRGFYSADPARRAHLEEAARAFVAAYGWALEDGRETRLVARLEAVSRNLRGFAYEGAAMGLRVLDWATFWKRDRFLRFVDGPAADHVYMAHVAVGWAAARLPGNLDRHLARLDPLLRWLAVDGYGFHEGFFHWRNYLAAAPYPRRITGYGRHAFDQGLGRALWFVGCGCPGEIANLVSAYGKLRHPDLWSGIGLAAVYAGELDVAGLSALSSCAGDFSSHLAQGAAFAAKARHRAGNATAYTNVACWELCGMSSAEAASVTDESLADLPGDGNEPAYEVWRRRTQAALSRSFGTAGPARHNKQRA